MRLNLRPKIYKVNLSDFEKSYIDEVIRDDYYSARKKTRAKIIKLSDEGLYDKDIANKLDVSMFTIYDLRHRFCKERLDALFDKARSGQPAQYKDLYGKIIALVLCESPKDRDRWSISLIRNQLKQDKSNQKIPSIDTIRLILKKYNLKPWEWKKSSNQGLLLKNQKESFLMIQNAFGNGTQLGIEPGEEIFIQKITQPIINAIRDVILRVV